MIMMMMSSTPVPPSNEDIGGRGGVLYVYSYIYHNYVRSVGFLDGTRYVSSIYVRWSWGEIS